MVIMMTDNPGLWNLTPGETHLGAAAASAESTEGVGTQQLAHRRRCRVVGHPRNVALQGHRTTSPAIDTLIHSLLWRTTILAASPT